MKQNTVKSSKVLNGAHVSVCMCLPTTTPNCSGSDKFAYSFPYLAKAFSWSCSGKCFTRFFKENNRSEKQRRQNQPLERWRLPVICDSLIFDKLYETIVRRFSKHTMKSEILHSVWIGSRITHLVSKQWTSQYIMNWKGHWGLCCQSPCLEDRWKRLTTAYT